MYGVPGVQEIMPGHCFLLTVIFSSTNMHAGNNRQALFSGHHAGSTAVLQYLQVITQWQAHAHWLEGVATLKLMLEVAASLLIFCFNGFQDFMVFYFASGICIYYSVISLEGQGQVCLREHTPAQCFPPPPTLPCSPAYGFTTQMNF